MHSNSILLDSTVASTPVYTYRRHSYFRSLWTQQHRTMFTVHSYPILLDSRASLCVLSTHIQYIVTHFDRLNSNSSTLCPISTYSIPQCSCMTRYSVSHTQCTVVLSPSLTQQQHAMVCQHLSTVHTLYSYPLKELNTTHLTLKMNTMFCLWSILHIVTHSYVDQLILMQYGSTMSMNSIIT